MDSDPSTQSDSETNLKNKGSERGISDNRSTFPSSRMKRVRDYYSRPHSTLCLSIDTNCETSSGDIRIRYVDFKIPVIMSSRGMLRSIIPAREIIKDLLQETGAGC